MDKPGLYLVDTPVTLNGNTWNRKTLYNNGTEVFKTSTVRNKFGLYISDGVMYVDGEPVMSGSYSPGINPSMYPTTDGGTGKVEYMGVEVQHDVDSDFGVKCINITLNDYNSLLAGDIPAGYKRFDMKALYNIVDDVSAAPEVFVQVDANDPRKYTITRDNVVEEYYDFPSEFGLLNNLQGYHMLTPHEIGDNTFRLLDSPKLSIHDPVFRALPGSCIDITYMVDNNNRDFAENGIIGQTFTVIIKDSNDNVLFTNTTYAGVFTVRLKPFLIEQNGENVEENQVKGATWYSVEVVDDRGCGSSVVYADVFFDEKLDTPDQDRDFAHITTEDLVDYGIYISSQGEPIDDDFDADYCGETGWTGQYVYHGGGCLKIGCADRVGYIETPALWESGSSGTASVTVVVTAKYGKYYAPFRVDCGTRNKIVQISSSFSSYSVTFNNVKKDEANKVRITTVGEERRVYIKSVTVSVDGDTNECSFSTPTTQSIPDVESVDVTNDDAESGYWNIIRFNKLFSDVADGTYDGTQHEGVVLPEGCVFYTSYEGNQHSSPTTDFSMNPIRFYVAKVEKSTTVNGETVSYPYGIVTSLQEIVKNGSDIHIDAGDYKQEIWYSKNGVHTQNYGFNAGDGVFPCHLEGGDYAVTCDPLEFVINDGAYLLRVGNFNSNVTGGHADKIFVRWMDSGAIEDEPEEEDDDIEIIDDTDDDYEVVGDDLPGSVVASREYPCSVKTAVNNIAANTYPYLRTFGLGYIGNPNSSTEDGRIGTHTTGSTKHYIEPGYYYVVSTGRTNGPRFVFPDNFTVDFNNCTFKAVYCTSRNTGDVLGPYSQYNLHLKNGKFVGLFERYRELTDGGARWRGFVEGALCCAITGKFVGETLSTMTSYGNEFCTFENLDIGSSVGYNCRSMACDHSRSSFKINSGGNNINRLGYVDYDGQFVSSESKILAGELPSNSGEFHYNSSTSSKLPSRNYYLRTLAGVTTDAVLKQTLRITLTSTNKIAFKPRRETYPGSGINSAPFEDDCYVYGHYHVPFQNGRSSTVFISFYNSEDNFIKTIKTDFWNRFKAPAGTEKVIITGYGLSCVTNGVRNVILYEGLNVCFFPNLSGIGLSAQRKVNAATVYKNCYIHDTRSGAFSVEGIDGFTYEDCVVEFADDVPRTDWFTTDLLSAFEDGRFLTNMLTIKNLTVKATPVRPDGGVSFASYAITAIYGRNYTMSGVNRNDDIPGPKALYHKEAGLLFDGYIHDCLFSGIHISRRVEIPNPHLVYRHLDVSNRIVLSARDDGYSIYMNRSEALRSNKALLWDAFICGVKYENSMNKDRTNGYHINYRQSKVVDETYE